MNAAPPMLPTLAIAGSLAAVVSANVPTPRVVTRLVAAHRTRRARAEYRRLRRFDLSVIEHLLARGRIDRRKAAELRARSRRIRSSEAS